MYSEIEVPIKHKCSNKDARILFGHFPLIIKNISYEVDYCNNKIYNFESIGHFQYTHRCLLSEELNGY